MIKSLMWILLVLVYSFNAYAEAAPNIKLTPQEGFHQFPFFELKTSVWNYNDQIPGPIIKAKAGTILSVDVENQLTEPTRVSQRGQEYWGRGILGTPMILCFSMPIRFDI